MHTIKSRVRHTAWDTAKGSRLWNPWARKISPSGNSPSDEENPHESSESHNSRAPSEACAADHVEMRRIGGASNGPTHASTMPPPSPDAAQTTHSIRHVHSADATLFKRRSSKSSEQQEKPALGRHASTRSSKSRKRKQPVITPWTQFQHVVFGNWFNVLLLAIPAGFVVYYTNANPIVVFCLNFVAIMPLVITLEYGLHEVGLHVGDGLQVLLSITFGNAVQLISSILLLKSRQIAVLQASLLGNILSNLLFMTGLSFLCGGMKHEEQNFNGHVAHTVSTFLLLASLCVVVPTVSHFLTQVKPGGIVAQSRGSSIIILVSYVLWLFFQNVTHKQLFDNTSEPGKLWNNPVKPGQSHEGLAAIGAGAAGATGGKIHETNLLHKQEEDDDVEEEELPVLTTLAGGITTVVATVLIGFHSEFATNSIQGLCQRANISQKFVGLVILPILSFDPSAVAVAMKDKMDLSISFTLEKCMQTSLLVVPFVIIIAWGMGIDDMTLEFDGFSTASLFASNLIVSYVVQAGRSNWLTGALLVKIYLIIALAAFFIE